MPSNIAEGKARQSTAIHMNHLDAAALISDTQEIGRMLQGLIKSLEQKILEPDGHSLTPGPPLIPDT